MDIPDFIKSLDFLLEVAHHSGNDRAFLRSLNKTTRHAIDKTIRLSQPVDGREFVRWVNETASRTLSRDQQAKLGAMTAQSGSIENLENLLNLKDMTMPGISTRRAFESAALVPNERVCALLLQHDPSSGDLAAAAEGGSRAICEEILRIHPPVFDPESVLNRAFADLDHVDHVEHVAIAARVSKDLKAAGAAASRGHVALADWLCTVIPGTDMCNLLVGAAKGCDLSTLQRLYREHIGQLDLGFMDKLIAAAAASTTPDWLAKVDWLETVIDHRINKKSDVYSTALLSGPDWLARLEALGARDYPIDGDVVGHAARVGNTRPLEYILSFYNFPADTLSRHYRNARGPTLQLLLDAAAGADVHPLNLIFAVNDGDLPASKRLREVLQRSSSKTLLSGAIRSGNMELLSWLVEQGCQLTEETFRSAVLSGSLAQVSWLVEQGCPMSSTDADGPPDPYVDPYMAALDHPAMLEHLLKLDCPRSPRKMMRLARHAQRLLSLPQSHAWVLRNFDDGTPAFDDLRRFLTERAV